MGFACVLSTWEGPGRVLRDLCTHWECIWSTRLSQSVSEDIRTGSSSGQVTGVQWAERAGF